MQRGPSTETCSSLQSMAFGNEVNGAMAIAGNERSLLKFCLAWQPGRLASFSLCIGTDEGLKGVKTSSKDPNVKHSVQGTLCGALIVGHS